MRIILTICFYFLINSFFAQLNSRQLICAGGQSNSNSVLSAMWSVGQPAIVKNAMIVQGQEVLMSQGFHKSGQKNLLNSISVSLYPNPFNSEINLSIEPFEKETYFYLILDVTGKEIVKSTMLLYKNELISVKNLSTGAYYLVLSHKNGTSYSYEIMKTND